MDKLADVMLLEAKKEANETLAQAEKAVAKTFEDLKESSKEELKKSEEDAKNRLKSQKKEKIAWARLEKKKTIAEAKEDVVKQELEKIILELPNLRSYDRYAVFLKEKAMAAIEELSGSGDPTLTLHICKGDKKFLSDLNVKATVSIIEDLEASGGLIAENSAKTIRVDYTLESIFEVKKPEIRRGAYVSLFGGK